MTARDCPYVGLSAYGEHDADYFFGREREIDLVQANLQASRLTLLYGESGVGKSSILHAGVMRDLRAEVEENLARLRRDAVEDDEEPEKPSFAVALFRGPWVDPPLPRLMETIQAAVHQAVGDDVPEWAPGDDVVDTLRGWTGRVRTILVVLDQFEEYFLYHPEDEAPDTVAGMLPAVVNDQNLRVNFLLSIREDALAKLDRFKKHIPIFGNVLRIRYLDERAAKDAIERPLGRFSELAGNGDGSYRAEPELVDEIIRQVGTGRVQLAGSAAAGGDATGNGGVETPVLQLVLTRLWEEERGLDSRVLRLETFRDRLQGAESIVRTQLDRTMATLTEPEKDVAARSFRYLVTPSGSKFAQSVSDLAGFAEVPRAEIEPVLEKLTGGRILRPVPPPPGQDEARYEIFHDALGPTVLDWSTRHLEQRARAEAEAEAKEQTAKARRRARIWAGVGVLSLLFAAGVGLLAYVAVEKQREADESRRDAESSRILSRSHALLPIDPHGAIRPALTALDRGSTEDASLVALRAALAESRLLLVHAGDAPLYAVAVSPDGRWMLSGGEDGVAHLIDTRAKEAVRLEGHGKKAIRAVAFDATGKRAVTADDGGLALVWDVAPGPRTATAELNGHEPHAIYEVAFSPSEPVLATASYEGFVRLWNAETGQALGTPLGSEELVMSAVAFSPEDGRLLAAADWSGTVHLWERPPRGWRTTPEPAREFVENDYSEALNSVSISVDGRRVAAASDGWFVLDWDIQKRSVPDSFYTSDYLDGEAIDAAFSPDGTWLAGVAGKKLYLWDAKTGDESHTITSTDWLSGVEFRGDGRLVLASGSDNVVRVWEAATGSVLFELRGHEAAVTSATFTADGRSVVTASADGSTRLWDVSSGVELRGEFIQTEHADFGPDGRHAYTVSGDGSVAKWNARTGERLWREQPIEDRLVAVATLAGGDHAVAAGAEGRVFVLDAADGHAVDRVQIDATVFVNTVAAHPSDERQVAIGDDYGQAAVRTWDEAGKLPLLRWLGTKDEAGFVVAHTDGVHAVAYSPDGSRLATVGEDNAARVWNTETGELVEPALEGHRDGVRGVAFHPDGQRIATASDDGTVRVWRVGQAKPLRELPGRGGRLFDVAFNDDGTLLAAGGTAGRTSIWAWPSGRLVASLKMHAEGINSVAFAPDDDRILTASNDQTAKIYSCPTCGPPAEVMRLARERVAAVG